MIRRYFLLLLLRFLLSICPLTRSTIFCLSPLMPFTPLLMMPRARLQRLTDTVKTVMIMLYQHLRPEQQIQCII